MAPLVQARVIVSLRPPVVRTLHRQEECSSVERGSLDLWSRDRILPRIVQPYHALVLGWTRLLVLLFRAFMHLCKIQVDLFPYDAKKQDLVLITIFASDDTLT